ncbi:MAG: helix-turn-helix transcriptional regulator [Spirosomataceae bacterium]
MSVFGGNVRKYRKQKELTLKQLADILGVKFQSVEKWEKGLTMPKGKTLEHLCNALGVTINDLLYEADTSGVIDLGEKVIVDKDVWDAREKELEYLRTIYELTREKEAQQKSIGNLKNIEVVRTET